MFKNRRDFLISTSAYAAGLNAGLFGASVGSVSAQEVSLRFGTTNAPQIPVNVEVMHPWAKRINEQGKGVVAVDVRDGPTFANFMNYYDRVASDAVQISWGVLSLVAGKFVGSLVPGLPFTSDQSEAASVAFWRLIKSGLLDNELNDIVPLFCCVFGQVSLHTRRPLQKPDDISNLKIAAQSKSLSDAVAQLNGTPISVPLSDAYEALQRGTVDGMVVPWHGILPFKLQEVVTYHVEIPLGASVGMLFMSKKKFEQLPRAAQEIIWNNSGEAESRRYGAFWDRENNRGREIVQKIPGHTIITLSPSEATAMRARVAPVRQAWAQNTPNGTKLLDSYDQLLAQVKKSST